VLAPLHLGERDVRREFDEKLPELIEQVMAYCERRGEG